MTLSINTNTAAMAALESLSTTTTALNNTENEVSTGKKVSSAADNPAIYSISQSMTGNIAGLAAVSDSLSLGAQVVNTASEASQDIISTLQTLQGTVTSASSTGYASATMQAQVADAINQINDYARNSTFNGVNLLTSSNDVKQTGAPATTESANIVTGLSGTSLTVSNQIGTSNVLSSFLGLTTGTFTSGGTAYASTTAATAAGASTNDVQSVLSSTGVNIATSSNLSSADFGNGASVVLTNGDGTTTTFEFDTSGTKTTATDTSGASANNVVTVLVDPTEQSTSTMLGDLVNAMNQNGYNAVIQNDGSINVTGQGVTGSTATGPDVYAAGYSGTGSASGGTAGTGSGIASAGIGAGTALSSSEAAITTVQSAINKMDTISASLGATTQQITGMQSFTSDLSDALTTGVGALTDADLSTASAQLTSLQTKQQLAIQSLSIANSQSSSILSLFRG